jgi:hypothetical protein
VTSNGHTTKGKAKPRKERQKNKSREKKSKREELKYLKLDLCITVQVRKVRGQIKHI